MPSLSCFKAYDIRGQLGTELNEDIAYRVGRAYGEWLPDGKKTVVVGGDVRLTSESLKLSLADGLMDAGVNVIDLGMTGTEEVYFATSHLKVSGGVEVTASHNPIDYNGMKIVREGSRPVASDTGLRDIQRMVEDTNFMSKPPVKERGTLVKKTCEEDYVAHLLSYIDLDNIRPLKLVVNSGNGASGHIVDAIEQQFQKLQVPVTLIKVHHEPDGTFPNGIPNPLLHECREDTREAVLAHNADMGIAWDGDFDRCFLFDEKGQFIEGYYIVGLLAEAFLHKSPGSKIVHETRLIWNTKEIVEAGGGECISSKAGHSFIKDSMRKEDAIYGGEMSAHHYFRDFAYCDSGMIPWLLVAELLSIKKQPLSELVSKRIASYPSPGEINFKVDDPEAVISAIRERYEPTAMQVDLTDGVSLEFENWRFSLRSSNTEPVVRLNLETRGDLELMKGKLKELTSLLTSI